MHSIQWFITNKADHHDNHTPDKGNDIWVMVPVKVHHIEKKPVMVVSTGNFVH